jgi:hypothetical protein
VVDALVDHPFLEAVGLVASSSSVEVHPLEEVISSSKAASLEVAFHLAVA